jgi:cbb3-type cytochrome oxidase subunit 1
MPRLSRWFLRSALAYLALGSTVGALLLADRGIPLAPWVSLLRPLHVEFLLIGWMVQLALGVSFWILPRFRSGAERGKESLAWFSYGLLNAGVLGGSIGQVIGMPAAALAGHASQALAAVLYALHAWPRVKPALSR